MSFEIVAESEILGKTIAEIQKSLVAFLTENIPELTVVSNKYESKSVAGLTNQYQTGYLSYDGLPFGLYLQGYYKESSTYQLLIGCCSIDLDAATGATACTTLTYSMGSRTVSGVTYRYVSCDIIKINGSYIIRFGNTAFYLGYMSSTIAGKMLLFYNLSSICFDKGTQPTDMAYYGRAWVIGKANYYTAYLGAISCYALDRPVDTAVMCPVYSTLAICSEPIALPGIYVFYGNTNPGYDNIVEAAGVEVLQVNSVPVVVARPKV